MIEKDLSKQALDADSKVIQEINFTAYLDRDGKHSNVFYYWRNKKKTILDFSQGSAEVL